VRRPGEAALVGPGGEEDARRIADTAPAVVQLRRDAGETAVWRSRGCAQG
jgi:hypothetical protein